jgi:nitrogen fixation NifU-like protein
MNELGDLYQEMILEHYKSPRNFGVLEDATRAAHGDNPLCGDQIAVTLKMKGDVIEDVRFKGSGCAISTASASLMTEAVKGKTKAQVEALFERFHDMVMGAGSGEGLEKLEVFSGVSEFPVRVKCASLAWHTVKAALEGSKDTISTE